MNIGIEHGGLMDEKDFFLLLDVLRAMGNEETTSLENVIAKVIDEYLPHMKDEQKDAIKKEFAEYEKIREKKNYNPLFDKILEEETYQDNLRSFFGNKESIGF